MVTIISKIQATILIHSGIQLLQFILPNLPGHVNNLIFAKIRYILKYCNYSEPHSQNRCFTACFLLMWLLRHINWVKYACKQAYSALICMALNSYKYIMIHHDASYILWADTSLQNSQRKQFYIPCVFHDPNRLFSHSRHHLSISQILSHPPSVERIMFHPDHK